MASYPVSTRKLEIVKGSAEDKHSRIIRKRMGITVHDFLRTLRSSQPRDSLGVEVSDKILVWPKHTVNEICDPTSAVYRRDVNDSTWSLRFGALGCYKCSEDTENPRIPRTPSIHPYVGDELGNSTDRIGSQLRQSISTDHVAVAQTSDNITAAQHHQLEADLQLSESDDDNDGNVSRSVANENTVPMVRSDREASVHPMMSLLPAPVDQLLGRLGQSMPPLISPLSVILPDDVDGKDFAVSPLGQFAISAPDGSFVNEVVVCTESKADAKTVPGFVGKMDPVKANTAATGSIDNHLDVSIRSPRNNPDAFRYSANQTASDNIRSHDNSPSHRNRRAPCGNVHQTNKPFTAAAATTTNKSNTNRDFIQRLLRESEAILASKPEFDASDLSSPWQAEDGPAVEERVASQQLSPVPPASLQPKAERVSGRLDRSRHRSSDQSGSQSPSSQHRLQTANQPSTVNKPSTPETVSQKTLVNAPSSDNHIKVSLSSPKCKTSREPASCLPTSDQIKSQSTPIREDTETGGGLNKPSGFGMVSDDETSMNKAIPRKAKSDNQFDVSKSSESNTRRLKRAKKLRQAAQVSSMVVDPPTDLNVSNSDRVSMPPPPESSSSKKPRRTILTPPTCDESFRDEDPVEIPPDEVTTPITTRSEVVSTSSPRQAQDIPATQTLDLSTLPAKHWIFPDVPLTAFRSKLQQALRVNNNSTPALKNDLLERVRALLSAAVTAKTSSRQMVNSDDSRKPRSRALTGVLLVPNRSREMVPTTQIEQSAVASIRPTVLPSPPVVHTASCMTTPTLLSHGRSQVGTQCDLVVEAEKPSPIVIHSFSKSLAGKEVPTSDLKLVTPLKSDQAGQQSSHLSNNIGREVDDADSYQAASVEENRLRQENSADTLLQSAEESKGLASGCWKSLVSEVSASQTTTTLHSSSGGGRYRLLLYNDALHDYPVHLLRAVRHLIAASLLLTESGQLQQSADLLAETAAQLDNLGRRMRRVEAKLIKRRSSHRHSDPMVNGYEALASSSGYIPKDASWMHWWYYVLSRIRSVVHFREYRLRTRAAGSLPATMLEEISTLNIPPDKVPNSSNPGDADTIMTKLSTTTKHHIVQLIHLNGLLHRANADWEEANQLAPLVPPLDPPLCLPPPVAAATQADPSSTICSSLDRRFFTLSCDWHSPVGCLLLSLDNVILAHYKLVNKLKSELELGSVSQSTTEVCSTRESDTAIRLSPPAHNAMTPIDRSISCSSLEATKPRVRKKHRGRTRSPSTTTSIGETDSMVASSRCTPTPSPINRSDTQKNSDVSKPRKRHEYQSRVVPENIKPSPIDKSHATPSECPSSTNTTATDADTESIVSNEAPPRARTHHPQKQKGVKSSHHSSEYIAPNTDRLTHDPGKLKRRNTADSDSIASTIMPLNIAQSKKTPVTSLSTMQSLPSNTSTPNYRQKELPSPNRHGRSPPPPSMRRRSRSLAPMELLSKPDNGKRKQSHHLESRDNTYHPKRVRTKASKSTALQDGNSESDRSCSPPIPTYKPSVQADRQRASRSPSVTNRRQFRSTSVGRSRFPKEEPPADNSSDSIDYSPTKQLVRNKPQRRMKEEPSTPLPVYRVSRIPPSPPIQSNGSWKPSKVKPPAPPVESTGALDRTCADDVVPLFYSRWKNEPPTYPILSGKSSRKHSTQR